MAITIAGPAGATPARQHLYACGDDQVREYAIRDDTATETWRWTASAARDLPESFRRERLAKIDDCKPVEGGRAILVTASTGGVVLIDRATGKVRFRATAPMAHSADLLPGGRIAVALSIHAAGDRLAVYDRRNGDTPMFHVDLPSGHGVVWDARRATLFALSHDHIQAFALKDWQDARPGLRETRRYDLPGGRDGHDLSRDDTTGGYLMTTADGVWRFDPEAGGFVALVGLNPAAHVKAVSARRGTIAWVQAEESWWAGGFGIARGEDGKARRIETPGLHLYKVRWLP